MQKKLTERTSHDDMFHVDYGKVYRSTFLNIEMSPNISTNYTLVNSIYCSYISYTNDVIDENSFKSELSTSMNRAIHIGT